MRSPALAIAWGIGRRHRWGLSALLAYLLVLCVIVAVVPPAKHSDGAAAGAALVPLAAAFMYLLAIFALGSGVDLAVRDSLFPSRMFTLPVRTVTLVVWPMLYGTMAMIGLWLAAASLALRPWGVEVPLMWPALLAAVFLAWMQVFIWMPYGLPWLRVIVAVIWLGVLVTAPQFAVNYEVSESVILATLAPLIPAAYIAAWCVVGRARRGGVADWRGKFSLLRQFTAILPRRQTEFASPARAQVWFEWRRHGRSLPVLVGFLLPVGLAVLFVADNDMRVVLCTLLGFLLTPPFTAGFAVATVSKWNPYARDYFGVSSFTATRPLTSAALIAAKLRMAIWSTLAAWLLVLIAIPLALTLTGNWPVVLDWADHWMEAEGLLRAAFIVPLVVLGLLAVTWKQLVQNLYIGLTGRQWFIQANAFLVLSFLMSIGLVTDWIANNDDVQAALWDALPWIAGVLVCVKLAVASWIANRLRRHQLVSDQTLITGAVGWLLVVFSLFALLAWLVPASLASRYLLVLGAVLTIPLARLAAAPLALAWNRHR